MTTLLALKRIDASASPTQCSYTYALTHTRAVCSLFDDSLWLSNFDCAAASAAVAASALSAKLLLSVCVCVCLCLFGFVCLFVSSLKDGRGGEGRGKLSTSDLGDHAVCLSLIEAANRVVLVLENCYCHVADKQQNS